VKDNSEKRISENSAAYEKRRKMKKRISVIGAISSENGARKAASAA